MWFSKIAILGYATDSVLLFRHQGMVSLTKTNVYSEFGHPTERLFAFTMKNVQKIRFFDDFQKIASFPRVLLWFYYTSMYRMKFSQVIFINRHHFPDYHYCLVGCTIKNNQEITSKNPKYKLFLFQGFDAVSLHFYV